MKNLIITLLVISAVTALALGGVNYITEPIITERTEEKAKDAMQTALPADSYQYLDELNLDANPLVKGVNTAVKDGKEIGYIVEVETSGFGGMISMMVGVLPGNSGSYSVAGVSIVSMSETSGLGMVANDEDWRSQFIGKSGTLAVTKDGGDIDAITGATITSRAVTAGVNAAVKIVEEVAAK